MTPRLPVPDLCDWLEAEHIAETLEAAARAIRGHAGPAPRGIARVNRERWKGMRAAADLLTAKAVTYRARQAQLREEDARW